MSYQKVKSFSFSKDFRTITAISASNNCHPLDYGKSIIQAKEEETTNDFIKIWVGDIIGGGLQFNNKTHYIQYVIDIILAKNNIKSNRMLWASPYDYNADYHYDTNKFIYKNKEDEKAYQAAKTKSEEIKEEITQAILNGSLKKRYKELKKEKYVLTNGYSFLTRKGSRSFDYSGEKTRAKIFNGLSLLSLKNYYAITNYNYHFEKLEKEAKI